MVGGAVLKPEVLWKNIEPDAIKQPLHVLDITQFEQRHFQISGNEVLEGEKEKSRMAMLRQE